MTRARRGRSLFWTIAAAFLFAALLGAVAQSLVAVGVLRPLENRDRRARAELAVSRFEAEFMAREAAPDSAWIVALLQRVHDEAEVRGFLAWRSREGAIVSPSPERARAALAGAARGPGATAPDAARTRERRPLAILLRHPVARADGVRGEVIVIHTRRPAGLGAMDSRALLLSLPIALIASLLAALVVVRLLVRRLRRLEQFAARVAEDDLSARVEDPAGDELGRLSQQFNRMAERLAAARDRLSREEAQRRQLFADITHELATPLTSIRGYTETLLDPNVPVAEHERARYLHAMREESRRLDRLIRDLFELARLEAGASPLARERLDWVALACNVARRFEPRFESAGLTLAWAAGPKEAWVEADGHRLEQVVENLLQNALRYVPRGGRVTLAFETLDGGAPRHRLVVEDDGPGAPPEELPRLFERFYRSPGTRRADGDGGLDGSGLGLAIVREIVERHGGRATARGRTPHGLRIEVELPAR